MKWECKTLALFVSYKENEVLWILSQALNLPNAYKSSMNKEKDNTLILARGYIFFCLQPFYEWAVSDQDRSMHRSLFV